MLKIFMKKKIQKIMETYFIETLKYVFNMRKKIVKENIIYILMLQIYI